MSIIGAGSQTVSWLTKHPLNANAVQTVSPDVPRRDPKAKIKKVVFMPRQVDEARAVVGRKNRQIDQIRLGGNYIRNMDPTRGGVTGQTTETSAPTHYSWDDKTPNPLSIPQFTANNYNSPGSTPSLMMGTPSEALGSSRASIGATSAFSSSPSYGTASEGLGSSTANFSPRSSSSGGSYGTPRSGGSLFDHVEQDHTSYIRPDRGFSPQNVRARSNSVNPNPGESPTSSTRSLYGSPRRRPPMLEIQRLHDSHPNPSGAAMALSLPSGAVPGIYPAAARGSEPVSMTRRTASQSPRARGRGATVTRRPSRKNPKQASFSKHRSKSSSSSPRSSVSKKSSPSSMIHSDKSSPGLSKNLNKMSLGRKGKGKINYKEASSAGPSNSSGSDYKPTKTKIRRKKKQ